MKPEAETARDGDCFELMISLGENILEFKGRAAVFASKPIMDAMTRWFGAQIGADAGEDLQRLATKIDAGASAVDRAEKTLDTIGKEGA